MEKRILILILCFSLILIGIIGVVGWKTGYMIKTNGGNLKNLESENSETNSIDNSDEYSESPESIEYLSDSSDSSNSYYESSGDGSGGSYSGGCNNRCSSGETRCLGDYKQVCDNYDDDSCLEWPSSNSGEGSEYCEKGCENSGCVIGYAKLYLDSYEDSQDNLPLNIETNNEIYAADVRVSFPSFLEAVNVTEGDFLTQDGEEIYSKIIINNTEGKVEFASTRIGTQEGVSGTGELFLIEFNAINSGEGYINISSSEIVTPVLETIDVETEDGYINIS